MIKKLLLLIASCGMISAQIQHETGIPAKKGDWIMEIENQQTRPLYIQLYDEGDKPFLPAEQPKAREIPAHKSGKNGYYRISGINPSANYSLFIWNEPTELTELIIGDETKIGFGAEYAFNIKDIAGRKYLLLTIDKEGNLIPQGSAIKNFSTSLIKFDSTKNIRLKDITNIKESNDDFDEDFTII